MAVPQLNLNHFETYNRGILQCCGRVRSAQEQLQTVHDSLDQNEADYRKGRLPRNSYRSNFRKLSRDRRRLEREINAHIREASALITQAKKTAREQRA